jgi:signal transduction histidine kinase
MSAQRELGVERARVYLSLKWIAVAAIFCVISTEALLGELSPIVITVDYLGLALTGSTGLLLEWLRRQGKFYSFITLLSLLLDQTFVFTVLYFSGGPENSWWFLPVFLIFIAGYIFSAGTALFVACFSSIVISLDFVLEYFNLLPHHYIYSAANESWRNGALLTDYLLGMFMLYFMGALISNYFSRLMSRTNVKLEKSLQESEAARAEQAVARQALLSIMDDLNRAKIDLEGRVRERTLELEKNSADLEKNVDERTKDLAEARRATLHMLKDLKEDMTKLAAVDRMKTEFLSMVSHELRTPLTPIKGYLALILSDKMGALSAQQKEALNIVSRQSSHLQDLIESLLDLSRLELNKPIPITKEPLSLNKFVEEIIEAFKPQAESRQLTIKLDLSSKIPTIMADGIKMKRVLSNLIGNSIKFTPKGGEIDVSVRPEAAGGVRFEVSDNGIGIPSDLLEKIFEKFFQIESAYTQAAGGIGMGLAIAKELVELHGGRIWAESAGQGKGAKFIIVLPVEGGKENG